MRFLLALLAVMALLVSPVAASAAQLSCAQGETMAPAMADMPMMAQSGAEKTTADPCCDHGKSYKMDQKSCALACANACVVAPALPSALSSFVLLFAAAQLNPARTSAAHPFEPPGLIRPPKSMA
jgi:hypothetical protein